MQDYIKHTVLMSPSKNTDFEIHVLGMMGFGGSSGESVPAEISKIGKPILLMFGSDENDFPVKDITTGKIQTIKLAGGHHYDGNIDEVTTQIVSHIK
jgi:type IV secretory pathway VirJ component